MFLGSGFECRKYYRVQCGTFAEVRYFSGGVNSGIEEGIFREEKDEVYEVGVKA